MNICDDHDRLVVYIANERKKLSRDITPMINDCITLFDRLWETVAEATGNTGSAIDTSGFMSTIKGVVDLTMKTDHNIGEDYLHNAIELQKRRLRNIQRNLEGKG